MTTTDPSQAFPTPNILPEAYINSTWSVPKSIIEKEYKILHLSEGQSLPYINTAVRNDLYFHLHLSGMAVLGLANTHPIVSQKLKIVNIKWKKLGEGSSQVQVSGKRKVGAPTFSPDDTVCVIYCENGEEFHIKPYVRGRLVETNYFLQSQPLSEDDKSAENNKNNKGKKGQNNNKGKKGSQNSNNNNNIKPSDSSPLDANIPMTDNNPLIANQTTQTPLPPQILDEKLLEQYTLINTDPSRRGYLCMFLLSPEQMQLMLRLFLSTRDWEELISQRERFHSQLVRDESTNLVNWDQYEIPLITKALSLVKPTVIFNYTGSRPMMVFKKGHFKVKNGVYRDLYSQMAPLMEKQQIVVMGDENSNTSELAAKAE
jgi:hypothetical protein